MIAFTLSGWLADSFGWPSVFYVTGSLALIWFICFVLICFEKPNDHPRISQVLRALFKYSYKFYSNFF
jgi:MFS family permease